MRGVNKVIIIGTLGNDPQVKTFSNGGSITNISVATTDKWTDKQTGERREATEWHRITFSNRLAEVAAQYLRKGSKVYVEGSLKTSKWQDQNGQDRYSTDIRAYSMEMLDSRPNNGGFGGNTAYQNQGGYNNQGYNQNNQGFGVPGNDFASQGGYGPQGGNTAGFGPQGGYNPYPNQGYGPQGGGVPNVGTSPFGVPKDDTLNANHNTTNYQSTPSKATDDTVAATPKLEKGNLGVTSESPKIDTTTPVAVAEDDVPF